MEEEEKRLRTFKNWPRHLAVRPTELARAGFYYLGSADRVQCAFCRGILRDWEEAESPVAEHWRYISRCAFLRGTDRSNVPIIPNDTYIHDYVSAHPLGSTDEDAGETLNPLSIILKFGNLKLIQSDAPLTAEDLGIITQTAAQPDKAVLADRLATFANWPRKAPFPNIKQIAGAGFYYLDRKNDVKCFFCGGVIKSWTNNVIPWKEHAKWFPKCSYLLRIKGPDFVNSIQHPAKVVRGADQLDKINAVNTGKPKVVRNYKRETRHLVGDQRVSNDSLVVPPGESENEELAKLRRENKELKDRRLCKICYDAESNILFLPCSHTVACELCSSVLIGCPICRNAVYGTVKINK